MINRLPTEYAADEPRSATRRPQGAAQSGSDWRQWIEPVEELIAKYPGACLASAFVAGAVIAWWIKRR